MLSAELDLYIAIRFFLSLSRFWNKVFQSIENKKIIFHINLNSSSESFKKINDSKLIRLKWLLDNLIDLMIVFIIIIGVIRWFRNNLHDRHNNFFQVVPVLEKSANSAERRMRIANGKKCSSNRCTIPQASKSMMRQFFSIRTPASASRWQLKDNSTSRFRHKT